MLNTLIKNTNHASPTFSNKTCEYRYQLHRNICSKRTQNFQSRLESWFEDFLAFLSSRSQGEQDGEQASQQEKSFAIFLVIREAISSFWLILMVITTSRSPSTIPLSQSESYFPSTNKAELKTVTQHDHLAWNKIPVWIVFW